MKFILYWILAEMLLNYETAYWDTCRLSDTYWYVLLKGLDDD